MVARARSRRGARRPAPKGAGPPERIYVFGSDLAGRHTGGAALTALREHGAIYGHPVGMQGRSYAIPVRDEGGALLPLSVIRGYVEAFLRFAWNHRDMSFHVTRIGTGRDGHRERDMAVLFANAPDNCHLPPGWRSSGT